MATTIVVSSSPEAMESALAGRVSATVEAEYGDRLVKGSVYTLAHHGPRSGEPAPCETGMHRLGWQGGWNSSRGGCYMERRPGASPVPEVIGLSHLDLDTVGGVLAILGQKPEGWHFWRLAAWVDVQGPHRIDDPNAFTHWGSVMCGPCEREYGAPGSGRGCECDQARASEGARIDRAKERLRAYWAWSERPENRYLPPKDGSVEDVTARIEATRLILVRLFGDDQGLLAEGVAFRERKAKLNAESFAGWVWIEEQTAAECNGVVECVCGMRGTSGPTGRTAIATTAPRDAGCVDTGCCSVVGAWRRSDVIVRKSEAFTSSLYTAPDGDIARAIVAHNAKSGAITLSLESPIPGVDCAAIARALWGPEAGGRATIAGSPRGKAMEVEEVALAAIALAKVV